MNGSLSGGVGDEFPHIKLKFLFDAPPCRRGASLSGEIEPEIRYRDQSSAKIAEIVGALRKE